MYARPAGMSDDDDDDDDFDFSTGFNEKNYVQHRQDEKGEDVEDIFYDALRNEDLEMMQEMLLNGFNINQPLRGDWSALLHACSLGNLGAIELLIAEGANVKFNKDLFTPLMALCRGTLMDEERLGKAFDLIVSNGADVNAMDRTGNTALMYACDGGHLGLVKRLVEGGCDLNVQDAEGWSALFHAVDNGDEEIIQFVVNSKARLDLTDRRKRTAFQLALEKGYDHLANMLCSKKEKRRLLKEEEIEFPTTNVEIDPIQNLLSQMPSVNAKSNSGFSSDVSKLLWSMGVGHLAKRFSSENVQLNELLLITDERLKELGVRFSVHRERILTSVKKFHLHPWNKASLGMKPRNQDMEVEDGIKLMCNVTKHLHIISSTMNYLRLHQTIPIAPEVFNMCEKTVIQTNLISGELKVIGSYASNLKKRENVEPVDLIKPRKKSQKYFVPIIITTVLVSFALWRKNVYVLKSFSFFNNSK